MSAVRPLFVSMLATIIESVRVPVRPTPASEPSSRMFTRAWSAQGSSPSATCAPTPGLDGRAAEDLCDGRPRDAGVLGDLEGRRRDEEDHERGERGKGARASLVQTSGPRLDRGEDDGPAPEDADHDEGDGDRLQHCGSCDDRQRSVRQAVAHHVVGAGTEDEDGDDEYRPADLATAGLGQTGAGHDRAESGEAEGATEARPELSVEVPRGSGAQPDLACSVGSWSPLSPTRPHESPAHCAPPT